VIRERTESITTRGRYSCRVSGDRRRRINILRSAFSPTRHSMLQDFIPSRSGMSRSDFENEHEPETQRYFCFEKNAEPSEETRGDQTHLDPAGTIEFGLSNAFRRSANPRRTDADETALVVSLRRIWIPASSAARSRRQSSEPYSDVFDSLWQRLSQRTRLCPSRRRSHRSDHEEVVDSGLEILCRGLHQIDLALGPKRSATDHGSPIDELAGPRPPDGSFVFTARAGTRFSVARKNCR